jgi:ankyrin repeat protein
VTGQLQHLDLLESLMPDTSIFGNQFFLYDAIKKGDDITIRKLLATGVKIEEGNLLFESDLSLAISSGKVEVVDLLLDYGADIERRRPYSMETPLMEATKLRSHAIVKLLLQRGADSQSSDRGGNSSLHIACECGDGDLVELLLQHRSNIEQRCFNSMDTPLLLATRSGQCAIVDLLVQRGAMIEAADSEGKTPLHLVSELWDDKIAKILLKAGANPEAKESRRQRTPLHHAAEKGNLAVARDLLQSKAHIDAQDGEFGATALHLAAELGHTDIVSLLISKGAAVGVPLHSSRITPLHLASANGHYAVVKILIETGADAAAIQYPNLEGKTPLHLAAQNGHHLVARLLCLRGIVEKRDNDGNTPLLLAALGGHTHAAKVLWEENADIEARNNQGSTALHLALKGGNEELALLLLNEGASTKWPGATISSVQYAAFVGQTSVVQKLLELGVDIQDAGEHGEPALTCAASAGHTEIVSLLLSNKAELDLQNGTGCTALHQASRNGHGDTVRLLLEKGADFKLSDNMGKTALHEAASRGHEDVVRLLIGKGADCTAIDENFATPLHLAAVSGRDKIIHLLIRAGAVVDALASGRRTPLSFACSHGHESTARALLAMGGQVAGPEITPPLIAAATGGHLGIIDLLQSHRNADGAIGEVEALLAAAYNGHGLVIKKLLRWGGLDINAVGPGGASALYFAATNGHDSAIQALLEEGADVDQRSDMDWLPIHGAALNGHASAIRTLLNAGSDVECLQNVFDEDLLSLRGSDREGLVRLFIQFARATKRFYTTIKDGDIAKIREQATNTAIVNMRDGNGYTALHMAVEYNCTEAIPILCDVGTGVDTKNWLGRTALFEAVLKRNVEAQRLLLQYGSNMNLKDHSGRTALHAAVMTEQEVSVKILVEAGADTSIKDNSNQMNPRQYAEVRGYEAILPLLGKDLEEYVKE